jgi:hypothetical protein
VDLRISRWHQAVVHGRDWDIDLAQGSRRSLFRSMPTTARRTLDGQAPRIGPALLDPQVMKPSIPQRLSLRPPDGRPAGRAFRGEAISGDGAHPSRDCFVGCGSSQETRRFEMAPNIARFPGESRGPLDGGTSGGGCGSRLSHGSSPWAEGPRDSGTGSVSSRGVVARRRGTRNDSFRRGSFLVGNRLSLS